MQELFRKIGIQNFADLQRFKNECMEQGETLIEALTRYLNELGTEFEIKE